MASKHHTESNLHIPRCITEYRYAVILVVEKIIYPFSSVELDGGVVVELKCLRDVSDKLSACPCKLPVLVKYFTNLLACELRKMKMKHQRLRQWQNMAVSMWNLKGRESSGITIMPEYLKVLNV